MSPGFKSEIMSPRYCWGGIYEQDAADLLHWTARIIVALKTESSVSSSVTSAYALSCSLEYANGRRNYTPGVR